jgi:[methyl-Co(III) methanol-specific corrinoid protein]:coenzyme M methyltransferase
VAGTPEQIEETVKDIIDSNVNAVWPGCDIWPDVPKENMKTLVEATHKHG